MNLLCTDTAFGSASVCIKSYGKTLSFIADYEREKQAEKLINHIQTANLQSKISLSELDFLSANIGPGSFTGIRISLSAIKAICYALNKPFIGVTSFEGLFQSFKKKFSNFSDYENIFTLINANRDEVYLAEFSKENNYKINFSAVVLKNISELEKYRKNNAIFICDNEKIQSYLNSKNLKTAESHFNFTSEDLADFISENFDFLLANKLARNSALYIRKPDAKISNKKFVYAS